MTNARREQALRALPLLDLTELGDAVTVSMIDELCKKAAAPLASLPAVHVAAVCVWPRFVKRCRTKLAGSGVRIATVANFPSGEESRNDVVAAVERAVADGANEIDLVLDYRMFVCGNVRQSGEKIGLVRSALPRAVLLKVILETGELGSVDTIRAAARLAAAAGADFLKTSTGKVKTNATLESARILLEVARESSRPMGVKPSGGIRKTEDAAAYLALADEIMGRAWAAPRTFRFGASSLLDDLVACVEGGRDVSRDGGY
jgi:deoxyribose-phosphate aldolase